MTAAKPLPVLELDEAPRESHCVQLNASWRDYQRHLALRGDSRHPRIAYADGVLEFMSPSENHETIARNLDFLLGTYCVSRGIVCRARGSWTLQSTRVHKAAEPDNCYILGPRRAAKPHLAIEVIWTHAGTDKLPTYHALGVREVWQWRRNKIVVQAYRRSGYEVTPKSALLPELDLAHLARCATRSSFNEALSAFERRRRA